MKNLFQRLTKSAKKPAPRQFAGKELETDVLDQITSGVSSDCHVGPQQR